MFPVLPLEFPLVFPVFVLFRLFEFELRFEFVFELVFEFVLSLRFGLRLVSWRTLVLRFTFEELPSEELPRHWQCPDPGQGTRTP